MEDVLSLLGYENIKKKDAYPQGCELFKKETCEMEAFIEILPISITQSMTLSTSERIIDEIHQSLNDEQGLIEVITGNCGGIVEYAYSIVKTRQKNSGMSYTLLLHLRKGLSFHEVRGFFKECGITGMRDVTVREFAIREGWIKGGDEEGWFKDPYDDSYTRGIRMNISEQARFDECFPNHPLSEIRRLIAEKIRCSREMIVDEIRPDPCQDDIFLDCCHVAGTMHVDDILTKTEDVEDETLLELSREPSNEYDEFAIAVETVAGDKIGYIPRNYNARLARLMDEGRHLVAKVIDKEVKGKWLNIHIAVFMKEESVDGSDV